MKATERVTVTFNREFLLSIDDYANALELSRSSMVTMLSAIGMKELSAVLNTEKDVKVEMLYTAMHNALGDELTKDFIAYIT